MLNCRTRLGAVREPISRSEHSKFTARALSIRTPRRKSFMKVGFPLPFPSPLVFGFCKNILLTVRAIDSTKLYLNWKHDVCTHPITSFLGARKTASVLLVLSSRVFLQVSLVAYFLLHRDILSTYISLISRPATPPHSPALSFKGITIQNSVSCARYPSQISVNTELCSFVLA